MTDQTGNAPRPVRRRLHRTGVALALLVHAGVAGWIQGAPAVSVEERTVMVSGAAPEATVLLFGISYEELLYPPRISHNAKLFRAGADGTFRFEAAERIPVSSVWLAADPKTADYSIAAPRGYRVDRRELPAAALKARGNGAAARIESGANEQVLLLIRPEVGSWRGSGGRSLDLGSLAPVGDSPPAPTDFAAGDLLVVVEPTSLRVRTLRVR